MGTSLESVSDTAYLTAYFRHRETTRAHGLLRDPYAGLLAGRRGQEVARRVRDRRRHARAVVVRTVTFDRWLLEAVGSRGITHVIHLGAGFDTRPYRLPLPAGLVWVEVDLPPVLEHKRAALAGVRPVCRLHYRPVRDLADPAERRVLWDSIPWSEPGRTLVLTEGVLVYLPEISAADLARELAARPAVALWLADVVSRSLLASMRAEWAVGSAAWHPSVFRFGTDDGPGWFARHGWRAVEARRLTDAARSLGRSVPRHTGGRGARRGWGEVQPPDAQLLLLSPAEAMR